MDKHKIFISSVQKELKEERKALCDYLRNDALLGKFFEPFLFEGFPAANRKADEIYLAEVKRCAIYIGLLGNEYGDAQKGLSAVEREFNQATKSNKYRLMFIKGADDSLRDSKMRVFIKKIGAKLIRRRFNATVELITAVYAGLVQYLEDKELIRTGPFDATYCRNAKIADLDDGKIKEFLLHARKARGIPLAENAQAREVLTHLNLLDKGRPTHAAILLFGKQPQKFLISSEVKCAHFHGTEVRKPIPFYQVYKGTVFEAADQALNFVLSKIDLAVGTREKSVQAPVAYEIPPDVIREAIVNAVAHRDYTSDASVQVMLFSDRLEVWNPGTLPPQLTLDKLRKPHGSFPANPLLAESLYLAKYIERMGTGTRDMIRDCRNAGLLEPEFSLTDGFVTTVYRKPGRAFEAVGGKRDPVHEDQAGTKLGLSVDQVKILRKCIQDSKIGELMNISSRTNRTKFRDQVLKPLIEDRLLEMTVSDKPRSSKQKYRLTEEGKAYLKSQE